MKHNLKLVFIFLLSIIVSVSISILILSIIATERYSKNEIITLNEDKAHDWSEEPEIMKKKFNGRNDINSKTIFVSISSFRDPELIVTLNDLWDKAYNRDRIYVGILQQNDYQDEPECFAENCKIPKDHMVIEFMHFSEAKGPTYARSICEKLWNGQEYYMLVDSHMRFEYGWDSELLDMLMRCPRPMRTVITTYPEGYIREDKNGKVEYKYKPRKKWRRQKFKFFNRNGVVEFASMSSQYKPPEVPEYVPFWAACFSFSHSDILKEVPYNHKTPFLFFGEEIFMAARLFTHGWDLRSPRFMVCYHLWIRTYRKQYWAQEDPVTKEKSVNYVKDILEGRFIEDSSISLGYRRTLEDFWNYIGLDYKTKTPTRQVDPWILPNNFKEIYDEYYQGITLSNYRKKTDSGGFEYPKHEFNKMNLIQKIKQ